MSNDLTQKNGKNLEKVFPLNLGVVGGKYKIIDCQLLPDIKTRLAEMGLVKNTIVTILKKAPLGDPIELSVRGYSLCIRATEAEHYNVVEVKDE